MAARGVYLFLSEMSKKLSQLLCEIHVVGHYKGLSQRNAACQNNQTCNNHNISFLFFNVILTLMCFCGDVLDVVTRCYFIKFILLFTTTASTTAAQQIAKINPKIIIILILSSFYRYPNLFYLAALLTRGCQDQYLGSRLRELALGLLHRLVRFDRCKGSAFCARTQIFCHIICACLIFIDISQQLVLNLCQRVSRGTSVPLPLHGNAVTAAL